MDVSVAKGTYGLRYYGRAPRTPEAPTPVKRSLPGSDFLPQSSTNADVSLGPLDAVSQTNSGRFEARGKVC